MSQEICTSKMKKNNELKIIVIGDGFVGKTCLLMAYKTKEAVPPGDYLPTIFDNYYTEHHLNGMVFSMALWDTAGQETYDKIRLLAYPNTDCIILCFAIDASSSYSNVRNKWMEEINTHIQNTPIILVGTKADMRSVDNPNLGLIAYKDGISLARQIKAECYVECSAHTLQGVEAVFDEAVKACLQRKIQDSHIKAIRRKCVLL